MIILLLMKILRLIFNSNVDRSDLAKYRVQFLHSWYIFTNGLVTISLV